MSLTVGQTLWYVPQYSYRPDKGGYEVTIEKVGRRWATLANNQGRIDRDTLHVDGRGYSSPGRCWINRDHYEKHKRAASVWAEFARQVWTKSLPSNITEENIRQAALLLKLELKP